MWGWSVCLHVLPWRRTSIGFVLYIISYIISVVLVPVAVINTPTKAPQERVGLLGYNVRVQSTMAGKAWWQELEAAGHMASKLRKQREMSAGFQLAVSLSCSPGNPVQGILVAGFRWVFLHQLTHQISLHRLSQGLSTSRQADHQY